MGSSRELRHAFRISLILALSILLLPLTVSRAFAAVSFGQPSDLTNSPYDPEMPGGGWSPDGTRFLYGSDNTRWGGGYAINISQVNDGFSFAIRQGSGFLIPGGWSPDGSQVSFHSPSPAGDSQWVTGMLGQDAQAVGGSEVPAGGVITGGEWAGNSLLYSLGLPDSSPRIVRVPVLGGVPETLASGDGNIPRVSPDGSHVAFVDQQSNVHILDLSQPANDIFYPAHPGWTVDSSPSWSADGSKIFWSENDTLMTGELGGRIWSASVDPAPPLLVSEQPFDVWGPSVSADGSLLAFTAGSRTWDGESALYVMPAGGGETVRLDGYSHVNAAYWSPTANRIVFADSGWAANDLYVVDVSGGGGLDVASSVVLVDSTYEYDNWLPGSARLSLVSDKPGQLKYQWDSQSESGWIGYYGSFSPPAGSHVLYFFNQQDNGQIEPVKSRAFDIDDTTPSTPVVTGYQDGPDSYVVNWEPVTDSGSGFDHYEVWQNGRWLASTTGRTWRFTSVDMSVRQVFTVDAFDRVHNGSFMWHRYNPPSGPNPVSASIEHGVRLDFADQTWPGPSHADTVIESIKHTAPVNFRLLSGSYFEIQTQASFSGEVTITVPYSESDLAGTPEAEVRLFHWKDGAWQDITVSVDTVNNTISGRTDSFSPFAAGVSGETPVVPTPASSDWSLLLGGVAGLGALWLFKRRHGQAHNA